jgi:hypothetical protein
MTQHNGQNPQMQRLRLQPADMPQHDAIRVQGFQFLAGDFKTAGFLVKRPRAVQMGVMGDAPQVIPPGSAQRFNEQNYFEVFFHRRWLI